VVTDGIAVGFIAYAVLMLAARRGREFIRCYTFPRSC